MIKNEKITLAHGNGGIQMRKLLHEKVFAVLDNPLLREEEDGNSFLLPILLLSNLSFFRAGILGILPFAGL